MSVFIILLIFVGLSVGLAWYFIVSDHGEREPVYALWAAAALGMAGAFLAGYLESIFVKNMDVLSGQPTGKLMSAALIVALIEEICKFVPLALWLYPKRYFNEHTDGVIYFALAGLGFGLPENIIYTLQYGTDTGLTRLVLTPLFHAAITGLVGYCLINLKLARRSAWLVAVPLLAAVLLHAFYDFGLLSGRSVYQTGALMVTLALSVSLFLLFMKSTQQDQDAGLSIVGQNSYCRACGRANPRHHLYCTYCGKNA